MTPRRARRSSRPSWPLAATLLLTAHLFEARGEYTYSYLDTHPRFISSEAFNTRVLRSEDCWAVLFFGEAASLAAVDRAAYLIEESKPKGLQIGLVNATLSSVTSKRIARDFEIHAGMGMQLLVFATHDRKATPVYFDVDVARSGRGKKVEKKVGKDKVDASLLGGKLLGAVHRNELGANGRLQKYPPRGEQPEHLWSAPPSGPSWSEDWLRKEGEKKRARGRGKPPRPPPSSVGAEAEADSMPYFHMKADGTIERGTTKGEL